MDDEKVPKYVDGKLNPAWYQKYKDRLLAYRREYGKRKPAKIRQWNQKQYWKNHRETLEYHKDYRRQLKREVIAAYGGICTCCNEHREEFLTVDHVEGYKEGPRGSTPLYMWLKRRDFPQIGFRLLCMNCNFARGHFGKCPHEVERVALLAT